MKIEIDSALAERLAAGHRAEAARRRAADTPARGPARRRRLWRPCSIRSAKRSSATAPRWRFLQEADTRIAKVGPGALLWTWAVPVGPDGWCCEPDVRPAFDVAAHAEIGVKVLGDADGNGGADHQTGDRGRIHSLWYCDAFEAGRFEWAETGFVVTKEDGSMFPGEGIAPSARAPGPRVAAALAARGGTLQLGYPFIALSGEDARVEFAERWLSWFADAILGEFRRGMLAPIDPQLGDWRRD